jgi:hypothetical protein
MSTQRKDQRRPDQRPPTFREAEESIERLAPVQARRRVDGEKGWPPLAELYPVKRARLAARAAQVPAEGER